MTPRTLYKRRKKRKVRAKEEKEKEEAPKEVQKAALKVEGRLKNSDNDHVLAFISPPFCSVSSKVHLAKLPFLHLCQFYIIFTILFLKH